MLSSTFKLPRAFLVSKWCCRLGGDCKMFRSLPNFVHNKYFSNTSNNLTSDNQMNDREIERAFLKNLSKDNYVNKSYGTFKNNMRSGTVKIVHTALKEHNSLSKESPPDSETLDAIESSLVRVFSGDCNAERHSVDHLTDLIFQEMSKKHNVETMPLSLRHAIEHFIVTCDHLTAVHFYQILHGLHAMKFEWKHFKPETHAKIQQIFETFDCFEASKMSGKLVEYTTRLVEMKIPRECVDLLKLERAIKRFNFASNPNEFAPIFENLSAMEFRWDEMPSHFHELIFKHVSTMPDSNRTIRRLPIFITSLSITCFDCEQTPILMDIHREILKRKTTLGLDGNDRPAVLEYFEFLCGFPAGKALYTQIRGNTPKMTAKTPEFEDQPLILGHLLRKSLMKAVPPNVKIDGNFRAFDSFRGFLDYTVFIDDNVAAFVIFDDATCYNLHNELIRSHQFRDSLYARKYPEVGLYRMKRSEIVELGEEKAAELLCSAILADRLHQLELKKKGNKK